MPLTQNSTTQALGIQLESGRDYYIPGDTISGTIDRKAALVAPSARVSVTLHGRSKTTLDIPDDFGATSLDGCFRDNFTFFSPDTMTRVLFDGPLHIEGGGDHAAWPFVLTIPLCMDAAAVRDQLGDRTGNRVAVDEESLRLPASFSHGYSNLAFNIGAFVEYYLEATLRTYSNGKVKRSEATLPLTVHLAPDPRPPRAHFGLRPQLTLAHYKFVSHRLIPGQEDVKLSSSQRLQRFFNSKQVPCLTVKYETEAPGVIQLEHPSPVPLLFRAVPIWDQTSDAIYNVPQRIKFESVTLKITAETTASAGGLIDSKSASGTQVTELGSYSSEGREAVYLPFTSKDPPLNIGALMDLRLNYSGSAGYYLNYLYERNRICPAFKTANIDHGGHSLSWCIRVSVAGESHQVHGARTVILKRPSCESRPGEHGVNRAPPPAFETQPTEALAQQPPDYETPPPYNPSEIGIGGVVQGSVPPYNSS